MSFASRDFAGTSECRAADGTLITISSFYEGSERAMRHVAGDMRSAHWSAADGGFRIEGDARVYLPQEVLPMIEFDLQSKEIHARRG